MRLVKLNEAALLSGRSVCGFRTWLRRWNRRRPDLLVYAAHGRVDRDSLLEAIKAEVEDGTPGLSDLRDGEWNTTGPDDDPDAAGGRMPIPDWHPDVPGGGGSFGTSAGAGAMHHDAANLAVAR